MPHQNEGNRITVSVVMPVYNAARFLASSVGDILGQLYGDFELICVYDDGTTDGSEGILFDMARSDERIRVVHHEVRGCNACRNRGLDEARGKYLLFLDADDRFEKDMLREAVDEAEGSGCDIVVFDGDTLDDRTGEYKSVPWLLKNGAHEVGDDPFSTVNTTAWNKLFLRELIADNGIRFLNDLSAYTVYFVFMAVIRARRIGLLHKRLVHYRVNNDVSTTAYCDSHPTIVCDEFVSIKKTLEDNGLYEETREVFGRFAGGYLKDRLRLFRTYEGFAALYDALHDKVIDALHLGSDGFFKEIKEKTAGEYLFDERRKMRAEGFIEANSWLLPVKADGGSSKVVIYGAGGVGRDYFIQSMRRNDISVVCWVDRNYEKLGFPLQSPEVLKDIEYDKVLIAVMDERTAGSIRRDLEKIGIPEEKIIWEAPERI